MGVGGLGRHLKEVVDALERTGRPAVCLCDSSRLGAAGERASRKALLDPCVLLGRLPVPMPPGVRARAFSVKFDAYAAEHLPAAEHLIAFNGQAQSQFSAARKARYKSLSLISANSHLRRVARQHARAHSQYPLEGSWASRLLRRNLREYAHADRIYVASEYTRESFLEEGFPDAQLSLFQFTPDPRYAPAATPQHPDTFNIAYVGSLTVAKGVPLLVDAVRRLPYTDLRLELIGGWATRGMRRFVQAACAEDPRISSGPGDPLPHLRAASLYVHPSYEDGFAYAPVEALACGVPTIVSSDTGMKDLIDPTRTGAIVPTGDVDALAEAIAAAYRGELLG
jgi:glycosyltransferase involved in cell wall biosynthesis